MRFEEGQGVFGRIKFVDGTFPEYNRPYLIIAADYEKIKVVNVSSIRGKERKLLFSTNERLRVYNPPFIKPSFVKLDSLTDVPLSDCEDLQVLSNGATLDSDELGRIKALVFRGNNLF